MSPQQDQFIAASKEVANIKFRGLHQDLLFYHFVNAVNTAKGHGQSFNPGAPRIQFVLKSMQ